MNREKVCLIFLSLLSLLAGVFLTEWIVFALRTGDIFALPVFRNNMEEIPFADFWHTNHIIRDNSPYFGDLASYPPLVLVFARIFAAFGDYSNGYESAYLEALPRLSLFLFYGIFAIAFCALLFKIMNRRRISLPLQLLFVVTSFFTVGMIYEFERGNYILYALLPALFFMGYYDDHRSSIRELAYVCLGISAGIKLYPALLALVLLRKRQFLPFLRCVGYSLLALFVPFLFLDRGLANVSKFVSWMFSFTAWSDEMLDVSYNYSITCFFGLLSALIHGHPAEVSIQEWAFMPYLSLAVCLLAGLFSNRTYKTFLGATLAMLFFPNPSFTYAGVFLTIPLLAFLVDPAEKNGWDVAYLVLFALMISPVYLGAIDAENAIYTHQVLASSAMIAAALLLAIDAIVSHLPIRKKIPLVEPLRVNG